MACALVLKGHVYFIGVGMFGNSGEDSTYEDEGRSDFDTSAVMLQDMRKKKEKKEKNKRRKKKEKDSSMLR